MEGFLGRGGAERGGLVGGGVWGDDFGAAVWARAFDAGEGAGDAEARFTLGTEEPESIGWRRGWSHGFNNLVDFP